MLTQKDVDDLFGILAAYRKNDPNLRDKATKAAWLLSLKPYEKADVKEAIGAWFRKSKYWPEPAEIAALCPPLPDLDCRTDDRKRDPYALHRSKDPVWIRWDSLVAERRKAGIPGTYEDAEKAGLSYEEWFDLLNERGLGFWT